MIREMKEEGRTTETNNMNKKPIKILVQWSGGKDSHATLLWVVKESGFKLENIEAVFCDTGWEHPLTYVQVFEVCAKLGVKLTVLQPPKSFLDLAISKGRFPSIYKRFCTELLKVRPFIDYVLSLNTHTFIYQGLRNDESLARSTAKPSCSYFKYYFEQYGLDKQGKPKYFKYRKKDVVKFKEQGLLDDVYRPVISWTGAEVLNYILENGHHPNELYYKGAARVGCFPCIHSSLKELKAYMQTLPEIIKKVEAAEKLVGGTFFGPGYIPDRYCSIEKEGKKIPTATDVFRYVHDRFVKQQTIMFDDKPTGRCMSHYSICE